MLAVLELCIVLLLEIPVSLEFRGVELREVAARRGLSALDVDVRGWGLDSPLVVVEARGVHVHDVSRYCVAEQS